MNGGLLLKHAGAWLMISCGVLPSVLPSTLPAQQTAAARRQATRDSITADSAARAGLRAEEQFFERRLMTQRAQYLKGASWAEMGDRCNPGALRIFAEAIAPTAQDSIQKLVEHMEQTILARGVGSPLNTPTAGALLRTIVGWEAGIDRPLWDTDDNGQRVAFAAGLTGEVPDPRGDGCLPSPMVTDTATFVIPGFASMEFPRAPTPRIKAYFGRDAQLRARDEFFKTHGSQDPTAELSYFLIAPVLIWRDWALVGVNRPREKGGIELGTGGNGGAVYMMRRVGTAWRLVTVVRSWAE